MTDEERLHQAAWALSLEADAAPAPVAATRARILQRLQQSDRPRARRSSLVLGAALLLSGSVALATVGQPLARQLWQAVVDRYGPAATGARGAPRPRSPARPPIPAPGSGARIVPLPPPVAAPIPLAAGPSPVAGGARRARSGQRSQDPSLALFQRAQRLHFHQRDFPSALAAWDAFLARHPSAPLALEAGYNRALCLVRLGQRAAAATALAPFADGTVIHYRQAEARALMQALRAPPGGQ